MSEAPKIIMPAEHRRQQLPAPVGEAATILSVIERAARDPAVDIDKMERLMAMAERSHARAAEMAFNAALAELQPLLPVITERGGIKDRSGKVQSTYAKWEDINDAIRPLLAEHGFALSFRTGVEGGKPTVTGVLSHRDGHSERTTIILPYDGSGSKNDVQAVGSSTSYGKRYTAIALLNITTRGEDDDGRRGGAPEMINEDQRADLVALMDEVGADRTKFLDFLKIEGLHELPAKRFQEAVNALEAKRRAG